MISKVTYTFCLIAALCISLSDRAVAQQQKMGYVNTDIILNKIPEYKGVTQQLQVASDQWKQQLDQMQQQIDTLKEDFNAKKILYTDEIRAEKQQQIDQKIEVRNQYREQKFGPQGDYFKKQQALLQPIQRKVYQAITAVAQRDGIDFVFDRAKNTTLLYSRKQWNLNDEVLRELGISLNN